MTQSTTVANGKNSSIHVDDENGAPVDVAGTGNSWQLDVENMTGQAWTYSGEWPITLDGKSNAKLTIKFAYSPTQNEGADLMRDWINNKGARTITIDYPDSSVGSDRVTGDWRINDFSTGAKAQDGEPMFVECTFSPDGTITPGKIAS